MKIQYVSDLHIDSSNMSSIVKNGDVLVVAGDVSVEDDVLVTFFERKTPDDTPLIFVPGNHEHELKDVLTSKEHFSALLAHLPHVHVLQNSSVVINNVEFIGATLWSDFEGEGLARKEALKEWSTRINDFYTIGHGQRQITPDSMARLSKHAQAEIERLALASAAAKKVVVTHYAPHPRSNSERYQGRGLGCGYWANDLPHLLGLADLWIHGHVHDSKNYVENGTRVVCNPRGYSETFDLAENVHFDPMANIEL